MSAGDVSLTFTLDLPATVTFVTDPRTGRAGNDRHGSTPRTKGTAAQERQGTDAQETTGSSPKGTNGRVI